MKSIRKRLSFANIMSAIAVFIALGGIAVAAGLPKNSVGKKQLKSNAVTTAKIKKNAVTTPKIKNGAVNGAKVKNDSLTGTQINESTLGTVPSASTAAKASKTEQIVHIFFTANEGAPKQTILSLGGLTITAECPSAEGDIELEGTTSVSHSVIDVVTAQDNDNDGNSDFLVGETFDLDLGHEEGPTEMYTAQYTRPDGVDVVVIYHKINPDEGGAFPGTPQASKCLVSGLAYIN